MNLRFLLPKQPIFFELFSQLSDCLEEMALLFKEFAVSFRDFENYSKRAKEIEHRADTKTHEIIERLNKTFITPFDREDIYLLAHKLDDIIDLIENVIHNIELYHIREKKNVLDEFASLVTEASSVLCKLIISFQEQKNTPELKGLIVKIHNLEDRGDLIFQKTIEQIFREEKDPMSVIKWKDILENLEEIMDKYQTVSDTIEGIIVKAS